MQLKALPTCLDVASFPLMLKVAKSKNTMCGTHLGAVDVAHVADVRTDYRRFYGLTRKHFSRMRTAHFSSSGVSRRRVCPTPQPMQTPVDTDPLGGKPPRGKPHRCRPPEMKTSPSPEADPSGCRPHPAHVTYDACWEANPL